MDITQRIGAVKISKICNKEKGKENSQSTLCLMQNRTLSRQKNSRNPLSNTTTRPSHLGYKLTGKQPLQCIEHNQQKRHRTSTNQQHRTIDHGEEESKTCSPHLSRGKAESSSEKEGCPKNTLQKNASHLTRESQHSPLSEEPKRRAAPQFEKLKWKKKPHDRRNTWSNQN
ncbi:Uncharacterized protein TCM_011457 [Theobroma cacao]|uniref:Uncharacterized protein n=1 Tax=Theobroma cacao TaxID=3641 RepID=A0A061E9D6_THECC|nr:Uncharacterized protein TCM_011457 [Theobroma cacao]